MKQFKKLKGLDLSDLSDQITAAEILLNINADDMTWIEFSKKLNDLVEVKGLGIKCYGLDGERWD